MDFNDYIGNWLEDPEQSPTLDRCLEDLLLIEECPQEYDVYIPLRAVQYIKKRFKLSSSKLDSLKCRLVFGGTIANEV